MVACTTMTAERPKGSPSTLTLVADAAARTLLLVVLEDQDWNLSATSEALRMGSAANVLRAIKQLGLEAEYRAAKAAGKLRPGPKATR